jgi:hypothetical protein
MGIARVSLLLLTLLGPGWPGEQRGDRVGLPWRFQGCRIVGGLGAECDGEITHTYG